MELAVKVFHQRAGLDYLARVQAGRQPYTELHARMVSSRIAFKKALADCKSDELREICKSIQEKNIPPDIVLIVMHYLKNQSVRVLWSGEAG
ncbi:hypothetical protein E2C01_082372 [Portunus trituberculatus]|uniref:Uncharacterized protein n=1 Tax=Portunus trituberculatus TaxID=210409 RepID=A0A5B7IYX5_PORTR|nr:hypothetical protein [Portunus trituberculatus]